MIEIRRTLIIQAPVARVWAALTDPRLVRRYYHGLELRAKLRRGGDFSYWGDRRGRPVRQVRGRVLAIQPGRRLVTSFAFEMIRRDRPSRVEFALRPFGRATRLTVRHRVPARSITRHWVEPGWDLVLSGLKTLLETGRPLRW